MLRVCIRSFPYAVDQRLQFVAYSTWNHSTSQSHRSHTVDSQNWDLCLCVRPVGTRSILSCTCGWLCLPQKGQKYVQRISMMASWSREKPLGYIWTVGHGHTYCSLIFIIRSCFSGFGPLDNRIKATYESSSPIQLINSTSSSLLNRYKYSLHPEWGMIRSSIPKKKNEQ